MFFATGRRFAPRYPAIPLFLWVVAAACFATACPALAQQEAGTGPNLVVKTTSLPKGLRRQPYYFRLKAEGGITPLKWEVSAGMLPVGFTLSEDGILEGTPGIAGEFRFVVTVSDNSRPPRQRDQELVLLVVTPLLVEWSRYPTITGHRVDGAVKISNQTGQDFDLTVIAVAVNEIGRATAVGYQHFTLNRDTADVEVPLGENLPGGSYELNVDVVGEVAAINTIYRGRLVTKERLQVQQQP
jgi:hypothetical protein